MPPVFEARSLTKRYDDVAALDSIDVSIPAGSIVGLIGPNGSGKSTLLLHASGQCLPTSGTAETFGTPGQALGAAELSRLGVVHQQDRFLPWMTIRQQLAYVGSFYDTWDAALEARLIDDFELETDVRVAALSPGNAQKLSIILAVCHRPDLLLLDEPVSALDPLARETLFRHVFESLACREMTVIVSSHGLRDVERLVDRVICLEKGKVATDAALDDLRETYACWRVTSSDELPASFDEPFILDHTGKGRQASLVVKGADADPDAFAARHGVTVTVQPMGLEAIYPFLVGGRRWAA